MTGEQGFKWWVGVVEDREDPKQIGRVRVRIYSVHPFKNNGDPDKTALPTEHLPWAVCLNTVVSAGLFSTSINDGIGVSPVGLMVGSTVVGFFADGSDSQIPIVLGSIAGLSGSSETPELPGNSIEKNSVGAQKNNKKIVASAPFPGEPDNPYAAKYPYNKAMRTEAGHLIEIDDTPTRERIHIFHKSGSYLEMNGSGDIVFKSTRDNYEITTNNNNVYMGGNLNMVVKGNVNTKVNGSYDLNVTGNISINGNVINLNRGTRGAARLNDTTSDNDSETNGPDTGKITSSSSTVIIGD